VVGRNIVVSLRREVKNLLKEGHIIPSYYSNDLLRDVKKSFKQKRDNNDLLYV
jgi:hypothetical protein